MVFAIAARLIRDDGLKAARDFIAEVSAHIDALRAWEERMAIIARETALRGTPEPMRTDCDTEEAFQSAHRFWSEAQALQHRPYPAPSARMPVERAIQVHTAPDGSRTYTYADDDEWCSTVYRDRDIQRAKRSE
jgi:hypothetical protein